MAIVPCIHNSRAKYPENSSSSINEDDNMILVRIIQQEFRRLTSRPHLGAEEVATSYRPCKPLATECVNPFCEECEELLMEHLPMSLPLSYFSAEQLVHNLRQLVHQNYIQLIKEANYHGQSQEEGLIVKEVNYGLNVYTERSCNSEAEASFKTDKDGRSVSSDSFVKITVDDDWAVYLPYKGT